MLTTIFPPKKSLKNLMINVLMTRGSVTINQIKKIIKKDYNHSATYQGIHKILHQFEKEKIVYQKNKLWQIDPLWVQELRKVIEMQEGSITFYDKDMKTLQVNSMTKALQFFMNNSKRLKNKGDNIFICHFKNVGLFLLNKEERAFFRTFAKENDCHIIIENDNFINRFCARYFKSLGMNVYMGIPRSTPQIVAVYGNSVINIFFHFDIISYMNEKYSKITSFRKIQDLKAFERIRDKQGVTFTFNTNKNVVSQTRNHLQKLYK